MSRPVLPVAAAVALAGLAADAVAEEAAPPGFAAVARYVGAAGEAVGGRYRHEATGVEVVVLRIESVPQALIHVGTPPNSDRGEPHTQEHLLLGKGAKGKAAALAEDMSCVESTAYTEQTYTAYSLNCAAGEDTFLRILEQDLDALLFPDYTDEEIEREVWHLGAAQDATTGALRPVDRGTVFNEMLVSYEKRWVVWHEVGRRLYGRDHPLSWSAGGEPDAIRTMTPKHIHDFHRATYHLSPNLGIVASLPPELPAARFLARLGAVFDRLAATPGHAERPRARATIPPPRPARDRSIVVVPYPNENEEDAGLAILAWPPRERGAIEEHLLRRLFLEAFAGGETSHLYRLLLDRASRRLEVEARAVWGMLGVTEVSEGALIGLSDYAPQGVTEERLRAIERLVRAEVDRLAALPAGDPELAAFHARVEARLAELERSLKVELGSPPLFGRRGGGGSAFWHDHLDLVDRAGGADRSLLLAPAMAAVRVRLAGSENPWPSVIDGLGLRDAPIVAVSKATRPEIARRAAAGERKLGEALAALRAKRGDGDDDQAVLRAVAEAQERAARTLEERDRTIPPAPLAPDVPRTLDDRLAWKLVDVGGVRALQARFETMSAAEVALAFRLDGVRRDDLHLLPLVPVLLTGAGVRGGGRRGDGDRDDGGGERVAYDELQAIVQRDLLELSAGYDLSPDTGRYELQVVAAGADLGETRAALRWLERCIRHVDLSEENLPRLLDLVQERSRGIRARLGGADEGWVQDPAAAVRFEGDHLYLSAGSLHAGLYHLFRLRWLLEAPPPAGEARAAFATFVAGLREGLAGVRDRGDLAKLAERLRAAAPEAVRERFAGPLLDALSGMAADLPPASFAADLQALADQAALDLARPPAETLVALRGLLDRIYARERARVVMTGRAATLEALGSDVETLLGRLARPAPPAPAAPAAAPPAAPTADASTPARAPAALTAAEPVVRRRIGARLASGEPRGDAAPASPSAAATRPTHMGLVHETAATGVIVFSAAAARLEDTDRAALVGELASSVYAGAGPHAFFMQTWGAGLAYSNGLRVRPTRARVLYYAERCPDLVQTMRFVVDLARAEPAPEARHLLEYAAMNLVGQTRAPDRFVDRARAQAADLEDGISPEKVRRQREALLALAKDARAWEEVRTRAPAMTGRVLVGLGAPSREQPGGVFLTIAPERLLGSWESYVRQHEGAEERVHRIYPADFWVR